MRVGSTNPLIAEAEPIEPDKIGNLAQLILPELPGCSDLMVRMQLQRTLGEFCKDTGACVIHFKTYAAKDELEYVIGAAPCNMNIDVLQSVNVNGRRVNDDSCYSITSHGSILSVVFGDCVIRDGDEIEFVFSVFPKIGCDECPEWFKDRYGNAIVSGTMANLLRMKNRPWTDDVRASEYLARYENAKSEAAYRRLAGNPISNGSVMSIAPKGSLFI